MKEKYLGYLKVAGTALLVLWTTHIVTRAIFTVYSWAIPFWN